ncbi:MAG: Rieske (2Fe-2S) protein [Desulfocapsaceae bacterium]|nr:Rieske (2Fe-2S) protein [Desulfocapsaceae bacterium]
MNESEYIAIARVSDFKNSSIRSYNLFGKKIGIIKRENGSFYAIEIACKHQGADLTAGAIVNNIATCHRHQWKYNLETGECLNHDSPPLRRYGLVIEGDSIKVSTCPLEE